MVRNRGIRQRHVRRRGSLIADGAGRHHEVAEADVALDRARGPDADEQTSADGGELFNRDARRWRADPR